MLFDVYLSKIRRNIRDYGLWKTINKSLSRIFSFIYEKKIYRIYKRNLKNISLPNKQNSINDIDFKEVKENNTDFILQIEKEAEWLRGELYNKIKNGVYCLAAIRNNEVIGFNIINFEKVYIPLIHYNKIFRKNCAWSEHITVKKEFRRSGIATKLRYIVFSKLINRGIKWLYGGCLVDNLPSLNLSRHLDFEELVDINYIKIIGFKKWIFKRVKKY